MKFLFNILIVFLAFSITSIHAQNVLWNDLTAQAVQTPMAVKKFEIDPYGKIYALANDGFYFLTDHGNVWNKLASVKITVSSIAINSRGDIFISGSYGTIAPVVLYSSDSGNSWKDITSNLPAQSHSDDYHLDITSKDVIYCSTQNGLYFSVDNGNTWKKNTNCPIIAITGLGIHNDVIYIFGDTPTQWGKSIAASSDNGNTWVLSYNIEYMESVYGASFSFLNPGGKAILSYIDDWVDVHAHARTISYENAYSADSGKTWKWNLLEKSFFTSAIQIDSVTCLVSLADNGILRTTDSGKTWTRSDTGLTDKYALALIKDKAGRIFVGTKSGIYKSEDNGNSWSSSNTLPKASYYSLGLSSKGYIYTLSDVGVYRSVDSGLKWRQVNQGLDLTSSSLDFFNDWENMFLKCKYPLTRSATDYLYKVYKLKDGSSEWKICNGIYRANGMARNSKGDLFAFYTSDGGSVFYSSKDRGDNWSQDPDASLNKTYISSVAADQNDNIFLSYTSYTSNGEIRKRSYSGTSWTSIAAPMPVFRILGAASMNSLIAVGLDEHSISDGKSYYNLYISNDEGHSWKIIIKDKFLFSSFTTQPRLFIDKMDNLLVSYMKTLLISGDLGKTWKNISDNLTAVNIQDALIDIDGFAYVAADNGLFKSASKVISQPGNGDSTGINWASSITFTQNYPNPFNNKTRIAYGVVEQSDVNLSVYDMVGKKVAELVNENKQPGYYMVDFDGSSLPSGIYFMKITVNGFSNTKKIILVK